MTTLPSAEQFNADDVTESQYKQATEQLIDHLAVAADDLDRVEVKLTAVDASLVDLANENEQQSDDIVELESITDELESKLSSIANDIVVDEDGNKYGFAVLNDALQKIIFGVIKNGDISAGNLSIKQDGDDLSVIDGAGRSLLRYANNALYVLNYKIDLAHLSSFLISDELGRTWLKIANNALHVLNYKIDLNDDSAIISINDSDGASILRLSKSGTLDVNTIRVANLQASSLQNDGDADENQNTLDYIKRISAITRSGQWTLTDIIHILVYGQSLSRGQTSTPPISTTQNYNNVMLAGGVMARANRDAAYDANDFLPLVEQNNETPTAAICNGLSRRFVDRFDATDTPVYLGTSSGNGGKSIEKLSRGGEGYFESTVQMIKDAKALCDSQSKTYSVAAYPFIQGSSNVNTPTWLYAQEAVKLKQDLDSDVLSITNQDFLPLMPMYQVGSHRRYNSKHMRIALTQLALSKQYDDFVLAVPAYIVEHSSDNLHLTNEGSWLLGEYISRAIFETIYMHKKWEPLQPAWVDWEEDKIIVGGYNPRGTTLVIDDALCAITDNLGFDLFDTDDNLIDIIDSVTLTDKTTITITLTSPAPANAVLACGRGRDYQNGGSHGGPQTGARTNIRDNHGDFDKATSPSGIEHALHNASVMWQYSRKDQFNAI